MNNIPDILKKIIATKRDEISFLKISDFKSVAESTPPAKDFSAAIIRKKSSESVRLIAELKRASPSRGIFLDQKIDLLDVAKIYQVNGAGAISVLTDQNYFQGSLDLLQALGQDPSRQVPLLRKEFIIDPIQIYQSRVNGADSLLLIVAALPDEALLRDLHNLSLSLGMAPLVEIHDQKELEIALKIPNIRIIGINNRDLHSFNVDIGCSVRLKPNIPDGIVCVSESGINSAEDVKPLAEAGFDAILVGEKLITAQDIAMRTRELSGVRS